MKKFTQANRYLASLHNVRPKSLRLEALEDRQMLSATDITALAPADNIAPAEVAPSSTELSAIDISGLEETEATISGKLAKPVVTIGNVSDTSMKVTWTAVEGATGYRLQYIEADKAATEPYVTYNVAGLGGTIKNLKPDTNYIVRVNAYNGVSEITSDRTIVEQKTDPTPTIAVSQVEAEVKFNAIGSVVATFDANFADVPVVVYEDGSPSEYFKVEGNTVVVGADLANSASTHTLQLAAPGKLANGTDAVVSETFSIVVTGKLAKTTVSLVEVKSEGVVVSWTPVSGATGYSVQYAVGSSKTFEVVNVNVDELDVDADGNYTYALTELAPEQHYRVRVRALAVESGLQSDAAYVDATTLAAGLSEAGSVKLAKPAVTIGKVDDTSIKVSWTAVEGATGYRLQYIEADKAADEAYITYTVDVTGGTIKGLKPDTNYIIRVNAVNSETGTTSDRTIVEQKTAPTPTIAVSQVETEVKFNAIGTVVATFDANFADVPVVVYEDGAPSEYFKVEGNTVVVCANLANTASTHTLQLASPGKLANGTDAVVSETFSVDVTGKLAKTTVSLVEVKSDGVVVSWTPVSGATGYSVQYAVGSSKTFETFNVNVDELNADADGNYTYALTDLAPEQHYRVRVRALAVESGLRSDASYVDATTLAAGVSEAELEDEDLFDLLALSIFE